MTKNIKAFFAATTHYAPGPSQGQIIYRDSNNVPRNYPGDDYFTNPRKIVKSANREKEVQENLLNLGRMASKFNPAVLKDIETRLDEEKGLDKAELEQKHKVLKRAERLNKQGITEQDFNDLFSNRDRMMKLFGDPDSKKMGGILKQLLEQYYTILHAEYPDKNKVLTRNDGSFLIHDTLRMAGWMQEFPVEERELLFEYMKIAEDQLLREGFANGKSPVPPTKARICSHSVWKMLSTSTAIDAEHCAHHVFRQFYPKNPLIMWYQKGYKERAIALVNWDTGTLREKYGDKPFHGNYSSELWEQLVSQHGENLWDALERGKPLRRTNDESEPGKTLRNKKKRGTDILDSNIEHDTKDGMQCESRKKHKTKDQSKVREGIPNHLQGGSPRTKHVHSLWSECNQVTHPADDDRAEPQVNLVSNM